MHIPSPQGRQKWNQKLDVDETDHRQNMELDETIMYKTGQYSTVLVRVIQLEIDVPPSIHGVSPQVVHGVISLDIGVSMSAIS